MEKNHLWWSRNLLLLSLIACQRIHNEQKQSLSHLKASFEKSALQNGWTEGPFSFDYHYRSFFSSDEVLSLLGELIVHDRLSHSQKRYESKTFYKHKGKWKRVSLTNLFKTKHQMEQLRLTCEQQLKENPLSHFSGDSPLYHKLVSEQIRTFVIDEKHLTIIFDPYSVGGGDTFLVATIPLQVLFKDWKIAHPLFSCLGTFD